jgi:hypothetical protein
MSLFSGAVSLPCGMAAGVDFAQGVGVVVGVNLKRVAGQQAASRFLIISVFHNHVLRPSEAE